MKLAIKPKTSRQRQMNVEINGVCVGVVTSTGDSYNAWSVRAKSSDGFLGSFTSEESAINSIYQLFNPSSSLPLPEPSPPSGEPEWRTLKGLKTPFRVRVRSAGGVLWPACWKDGSEGPTATVISMACEPGRVRKGITQDGRTIDFGGLATKCWVISDE